MDLKDLKEQEITNANGEKENVIKYFSLSDIYITDRSFNIGSPRNEVYFDNIEEAISKFFDRDSKNSPILKYRTDFVENIVYEITIVLDENTRKLYNDSKNLEEFEKRVREKYYETNFKREYVAPTSKISENKELYDKYIDTQIKKAENFIDNLIDYDLNDKEVYDIFKTYYLNYTSAYTRKHLETFQSFKDLKAAFEEEKKEFEKKYKPKDWNENDQKKLDELISILKEENLNLEIGSETYSITKEKALSFSEEKGKYASDLIREIIPMEYPNIYFNYMELCGNINYEYQEENRKKQEETYEEEQRIREEQDNFKKTPEFDDKIKEISDSLGFGKYINFEEKLREELINRDNVNSFSIPVTLNNKRTGDVATFNINMIYGMIGNVITYRPSILDYDLTLKKSNGEEKTLKFSYDNGELPNAKEAIAIIEKQMRVINKEEIYAYLIDDYGISTDISNRIKNITKEDLNIKRVLAMTVDEYKQHFMLDISNEASMEGRLVTNAFYVICKGSSISEIEAPNAEEIRCDNCHNLEKITAENCIQVWAMDSNIKEENIEINYKGVIEGPELQKQLKL